MFDDSGSWKSETPDISGDCAISFKNKKMIGFGKRKNKHEEERENKKFWISGKIFQFEDMINKRNVFSGRMEATAIFIRSFQEIW